MAAYAIAGVVGAGVGGAVYQFGISPAGLVAGNMGASAGAAIGAAALLSGVVACSGGKSEKSKKKKKAKKASDSASSNQASESANTQKQGSEVKKTTKGDTTNKPREVEKKPEPKGAKKDAKANEKDKRKVVKPRAEDEDDDDSDADERFLRLGQKEGPGAKKVVFQPAKSDDEDSDAKEASRRPRDDDSEDEVKEGKVSKSTARRRKARLAKEKAAAEETAGSRSKAPAVDKDGFEAVQIVKRTKKPAGAVEKKAPEPVKQEKKTAAPGNSDTIELDSKQIGLLIGKGGETLKKMEAACGVRIQTPDKESGGTIVTITGDPDALKYAKGQIKALCTQGTCTALNPDLGSGTISVPGAAMGVLIGPKGVTLQAIQKACGVKITTPGRDSDSDKVIIAGNKDGVKKAKDAIKQLIDFGYSSITHEGWTVDEVDFPTAEFGTLIGPGGHMIKSIMGDTKTKITLPNESNRLTKVQVVGPAEGVARAIKQISTLLAKKSAKEAAAAAAANRDSDED